MPQDIVVPSSALLLQEQNASGTNSAAVLLTSHTLGSTNLRVMKLPSFPAGLTSHESIPESDTSGASTSKSPLNEVTDSSEISFQILTSQGKTSILDQVGVGVSVGPSVLTAEDNKNCEIGDSKHIAREHIHVPPAPKRCHWQKEQTLGITPGITHVLTCRSSRTEPGHRQECAPAGFLKQTSWVVSLPPSCARVPP